MNRLAKLPYCIKATWPTGVGSNHPSVKKFLSKHPNAKVPIEMGDRFETIQKRDEFLKLFQDSERDSDVEIELYEDHESPCVTCVDW